MLRFGSIIIASLFLFGQGLAQNCDPGCFKPGHIKDTTLIETNRTVRDAQACHNYCQGIVGCEFWTYLPTIEYCLAFTECKELDTTDCVNCVSGKATCQDLKCGRPGLCEGGFDGFFTDVSTSDECLYQCQSRETCFYWTYNSASRQCTLFRDCGIINANCTTCSYGQRQCGFENPPLNCEETNAETGLISSQGWPGAYDTELDCATVITLDDPQSVISLSFLDFNVESSSGCSSDYLEVRDGDSENATLIGRYCGSTLPSSIISSDNSLFLRFITDRAFAGNTGFLAQYSSSPRPYSLCDDLTANTTSGIIQSINYPSNYLNGRTCRLTVTMPSSSDTITFRFTDLAIEECSGSSCSCDYVQVFDGPDTTGAPLTNKMCGSSFSSSPVTSTTNEINVYMRTDGSVTNRGFQLTYEAS